MKINLYKEVVFYMVRTKVKCELCGNEIVNGSHKIVYDINNHEELVVCRECIRGSYDIFYCDGHERLEYDIEYSPIEVENYGTICESLFVNSSEFHFCNECDRCFHENDLVEDDEYGYFCEECDEILNGIPQYHSHNYNTYRNRKARKASKNILNLKLTFS